MTELLTRLFVKNRQDVHAPRVRAAYGTLASITGIVLNLLLFVGKFTVGTLFGSISIVSDAINSLTDAGSQIISLISFRISARPADKEHPFGHARIEYIASLLVSILILFIGAELLRESVSKIFSPDPPEASPIAAIVLALSIGGKLWFALFNRALDRRIDSAVMRATATDSLSDTLSTGAVLIVTLLSILFPAVRAWNLDAYVGAIVSVLIIVAGLRILNESKNSILGEAPSDEIVASITDIVSHHDGALGIHDMVVHSYGPGRTLATLHIEVDGKQDIFVSHDTVDLIERRLREECGIECSIHLDPVVTDDPLVEEWRTRVEQIVSAIDARLRIHDFRMVPGVTHTNLVFDMAIPFEVQEDDATLIARVAAAVKAQDETFFTVITVDRV
jgi:cation diffusion facilitator family transporter